MERFLFISDTQLPFAHTQALNFCKRVQREFKIPNENVYHVGDETDSYHGSLHQKSPDADMTPKQELAEARKQLREWYKAFPEMKLAISNHGLRWVKKAIDADIPSQVIKCYRELIEAPKGWHWKERWNIQGSKTKMTMIHGLGYSGMNGHRNAAMDLGTNVIMGHLHSFAGINYINTDQRSIYGFNVGCLIDPESFAFAYGKYNRSKPVLGCGVVLSGGMTPIFIPLGGI